MNYSAYPKKSLHKRPGYGWAIVAIVFASMSVAVGTGQYAFGVFVEPLEQEFAWSRAQINASLSFFAIGGLSAPLVGWIMDRVGARPVMAASLVLFGASYLLRPFMSELWHWYALSIMQFAGMPGSAMLPAGKLIGAWFPRTTGRMLGIAMMGANFGGVVMPVFAGVLVSNAGWQGGYSTFGVICIITALAALLFVRDQPRQPDQFSSLRMGITPAAAIQGTTARGALRSGSFYAVVLGVMAASFTYLAVLTQIIPHLQNEGMTLRMATIFLGFTAGFGMAGKIVFGFMTERFPSRYVLIGGLLAQSLGLVILIALPSTALVWTAAPVYGMALGGTGVVFALLAQETFGLKYFGTIFGLINMATAGAAFLAPIMVGVIFDATGSYNPAFASVIGIFALGMLALYWARPVTSVVREDVPAADRESAVSLSDDG